MTSKQMNKWCILWLLFAVIGILIELFTGKRIESTWFFIIMSTMFNLGSSIMNKLEKNTKQSIT